MPRGPERVTPRDPTEARAAQERAINAVPPGPAPAEPSGEIPREVLAARKVEGATVQGRDRGARSFELRKRTRKEEPAPPPKGKKPPDPSGRGRRLDLRA